MARTYKSQSTQQARASTKRVRGRRGSLQSLPDMPLDILYEIFSDVDPKTLLALVRTSKELRRHLLSKSCAFIWNSAFVNAGLPRCPDDMACPEYASLVFDRWCHSCERSTRGDNIAWEYRRRICKKCLGQDFEAFGYMLRQRFTESQRRTMRPSLTDLEYILPVFEKRMDYIFNIEYYDVDASCRYLSEFLSLKTVPDQDTWLKEQKLEAKTRREVNMFSRHCRAWENARARAAEEKASDVLKDRENIILDKLRSAGYEAEISKFQGTHWALFRDHKFVKQKRPLTDRAWESGGPDVIELVERMKTERIQLKRLTYYSFTHTIPLDNLKGENDV